MARRVRAAGKLCATRNRRALPEMRQKFLARDHRSRVE